MSTEAAPRWRRLEPDTRRGQILACAIQLFGERPYSAVSTSDIAAEAGVARGLINHYFGTKRDLYLEVVRRMVHMPPADELTPPQGDLRTRIDKSVGWVLDAVQVHGKTWVAVTGAEGIGADPEVERILDEADEIAADRVLVTVGLDAVAEHREVLRAMIRAYGGMLKALVREWLIRKTMTREQVQLMLSQQLYTLVNDTFRALGEA